MSTMIQIRDVPEDLHAMLKARAAHSGMSLSDFLKKELEQIAARPTLREWLDRTRLAKPLRTRTTAAQVVRALRDER